LIEVDNPFNQFALSHMKKVLLLIAAVSALLNSGCVLGRRTVDLSIPQAASYPAIQGAVTIGKIEDKRGFQNKPSDPSTPSIDGDVTEMNAATKAIMIGRQRNGYGRAMGDIGLPQGRSVEVLTRELLTESLKRNGYSVVGEDSGKTVDAEINEFWAWFSPGMFAVSFESRVYCTLTVKRNSDAKTVVIRGYGINKGQVASDANWQLAYQRAFEDFLAKSAVQLKAAGL
jgi:uncharacterized lipoprotein YajG